MTIDENAIKKIIFLEQAPGGLTCTHYFYLLLQEKLFLFDKQIRNRRGVKVHLTRAVQLMDLLEDPHCPERVEEFVSRAQRLQREIEETPKS